MPRKAKAYSMKTGRRTGPEFQGIHRIIVPVDFSDASLDALRYSTGLARKLEASIMVVHVVPIDYGWFGIGQEVSRDLDKTLQTQAADHLRQLVNRHIPSDRSVELEVRIGRPAEQIIDAAEESKSDLIVLSTHGRTGVDRLLMGSVAERVARLAPCPVFLVRSVPKSTRQTETRTQVLRFSHRSARNNEVQSNGARLKR
jgi:nucleotide-binding universal stress UspA family protein